MTVKLEEYEVKTFVTYACCDCGGEFVREHSDYMTLEYPPKYLHKCNKCGKLESFLEEYPKIVYEEVEDESLES